MSTQIINKVPLLDLQVQYEPIKDDVLAAITSVFDSKQFIQGPSVTELETMVSEYTGAKHAIGMSSGTDALIASLMAMGIGHGMKLLHRRLHFSRQLVRFIEWVQHLFLLILIRLLTILMLHKLSLKLQVKQKQ